MKQAHVSKEAERDVAPCAESESRNRALARWRTHRIAKRRANSRRSFARNCSPNAALRAARRSKNSLLRAREPTREFTASQIKKRVREHLALDQRCCFSPKNFLLLCLICAMLLENFLRKVVGSRKRNRDSRREKRFLSRSVCPSDARFTVGLLPTVESPAATRRALCLLH